MGLATAVAVKGLTDESLSQASLIEVHERMGQTTTFRLRYDVEIGGGDLPFLTDERIDPGSTISIMVPVGSSIECLVKGPVTGQQVHLQHGGTGSWLEVRGGDSSLLMDEAASSAVYPNVADSDVVTTILTSHTFIPDVESTTARHLETKHALVQRESDLRFVRRLARRNGFLFWVTANALGLETAHFKRPPLSGSPDSDVVINLENPGVGSVDIGWDVERPTSVDAVQVDLNTKSALKGAAPKSPLRALGKEDLFTIAGDRPAFLSAPADDGGDLRARGEGALIDAGWFVRATCETSLFAIGSVVRAHTLAALKGAGQRHSGTYFVAGVRHRITAVGHLMQLELLRNAWGG